MSKIQNFEKIKGINSKFWKTKNSKYWKIQKFKTLKNSIIQNFKKFENWKILKN